MDVVISLAHGSEAEAQTRQQLRRLLERFDEGHMAPDTAGEEWRGGGQTGHNVRRQSKWPRTSPCSRYLHLSYLRERSAPM